MKKHLPLLITIAVVLAFILAAALLYHHFVDRPYEILSGSTYNTVNDPRFGLVMAHEVIVTFKQGATSSTIADAIASVHGSIITTSPELLIWLLNIPGTNNTTSSILDEAIQTLSSNPVVSSAEPDRPTDFFQ
jgi:hypothetical protein